MGSNRVFWPLPRRAGFLNARNANVFEQERLMGIEPTFQAWEAGVLPLHHSRIKRALHRFHQLYIGSNAIAIPCNQSHSCAVVLITKVVAGVLAVDGQPTRPASWASTLSATRESTDWAATLWSQHFLVKVTHLFDAFFSCALVVSVGNWNHFSRLPELE